MLLLYRRRILVSGILTYRISRILKNNNQLNKYGNIIAIKFSVVTAAATDDDEICI